MQILVPIIKVFEHTYRDVIPLQKDKNGRLCVALQKDRYIQVRSKCRIAGVPIPKGSEVRYEGGKIVIR